MPNPGAVVPTLRETIFCNRLEVPMGIGMAPSSQRHSSPRLFARMAVGGMSLAVVALGVLAVWAAIVTQNEAAGLSRAGVQTSGHLRAVQALSMLDTSSDALETRLSPRELRTLRRSQRVLDDSLDRMRNGEVLHATRVAVKAKRIVQRLKPAVELALVRPPGYDALDTRPAELRLEALITQLQVLLNDLGSDPSRTLEAKLDSVTATERTVRATAVVLIPLGLGGVAWCGWLLSLYRRRSEASMQASIDLTSEEARTDELTGLPNRRALLEELEQRCNANERFTLTLADLNGFKRYNDTFGHPAGDALLRRLARKLATACEGRGIAARLGGDEFCVLFFGDRPDGEAHALLREALSDEGHGFSITAASGVARVPKEAGDPHTALHLADVRMYAAKVSAHPSAEQAMSQAMTRMLDEHHPGLGTHVAEVSTLAGSCAEALDLSAEEVESVQRAAELHDIGKVAIPSAILTKNGPLGDEEWDFMRGHSIIGERILGGVPSLERVASMVRSSHERWDGGGYPDGLAGEDIPIGARIIFVADAFCAMTEHRPYASARSLESTRQELRACAGTQFDPTVVTAFLDALDSRSSQARLAEVTRRPCTATLA
jgi:diguanylate cyclase (GGDEF)-like protein